jgi:hypothetical protein
MCNEQKSGDLKYNPISLMKLQRRREFTNHAQFFSIMSDAPVDVVML